jgi:hypothetical protein
MNKLYPLLVAIAFLAGFISALFVLSLNRQPGTSAISEEPDIAPPLVPNLTLAGIINCIAKENKANFTITAEEDTGPIQLAYKITYPTTGGYTRIHEEGTLSPVSLKAGEKKNIDVNFKETLREGANLIYICYDNCEDVGSSDMPSFKRQLGVDYWFGTCNNFS